MGGWFHRVAGTIARIARTWLRNIPFPSLTHYDGGDIAVYPTTQEAAQPYSEITIDLLPDPTVIERDPTMGSVRFAARPEPMGKERRTQVRSILEPHTRKVAPPSGDIACLSRSYR